MSGGGRFDLMSVMALLVEADLDALEKARQRHGDENCEAFIAVKAFLSQSQVAHDAVAELIESLRGLVRYAEAVRYSAGMGKNQAERLKRAKALLVRIGGAQS